MPAFRLTAGTQLVIQTDSGPQDVAVNINKNNGGTTSRLSAPQKTKFGGGRALRVQVATSSTRPCSDCRIREARSSLMEALCGRGENNSGEFPNGEGRRAAEKCGLHLMNNICAVVTTGNTVYSACSANSSRSEVQTRRHENG
jgi:hypothetical protein